VANLAISNVPGPQVPLYLAGARMVTFHPLSIVLHGLALNITVQTYAGSVDFGIVADKQAVPHVQDLADALEAAFGQARTLFIPGDAPAPPLPPKLRKKPAAKARRKAAAKLIRRTAA
jgi:hypothetical protein